jgi:thiamine-phosphate pyrophosphorylase
MPVEAVRRIVGKDMLIGVSTHDPGEAKAAEDGGADFITFGPIFETPSKKEFGPPVGLGPIKDVSRDLNIPLFALGGIKAGNVAQVIGSGAFGVAMISAILSSEDITQSSRKIIDAISFIDKITCTMCAPR